MKLCSICRTVLAWRADSENPAPRWVGRHVRSCPACQRFQATQHRVMAGLRAPVHGPRPEPSPFLHGRIISSLRREMPAETRPFTPLRWIQLAAVPTLAACLAAVVWLWSGQPDHPAPPQQAAKSPDVSAPNPESPIALAQLGELVNQPFEREFHSVVTDAKAAVESLAANFLPSQMLAKTDL